MFHDPHDLEILAFFGLVALFELWERLRPARRVDRRAHGRLDVLCFGLAVVMSRISTSSVEAALPALAGEESLTALAALRAWPSWLKLIAAIVVVDFLLYWLHRAQHRFELLWRTHSFHHSVDQLWWFSGFRTSFLHSLLYNVPQAIVPLFVFQLSPLAAGLGFAFGVLVQLWEHSNVDVDIGILRHVVITPKYHRIHHAAIEPQNKNFAPILALWDKLFGTWVDPRSMPRDFPLGLGEPPRRKMLPRMIAGV
ncbi:MAG: sterol desaturase family protein [Planctomycetes bacterium]|nr:sterol desaturase family protein [Planctomycetota bacterium]